MNKTKPKRANVIVVERKKEGRVGAVLTSTASDVQLTVSPSYVSMKSLLRGVRRMLKALETDDFEVVRK
jgi:hypothetical protein